MDTESKSLFQGRDGRIMFWPPFDIRPREPPVKRKREPSFRGFVMSTKLIASLCPYCAVGCGLYLEVDKGIAKGIEYMTDHPACEGALCPKGNAVLEILNHEDRLKYPLKKVDGKWQRISWDQAVSEISEKMLKMRAENGPDIVEFLGSAKFSLQQSFYFRKFAAMWGTNNIDHVARI